MYELSKSVGFSASPQMNVCTSSIVNQKSNMNKGQNKQYGQIKMVRSYLLCGLGVMCVSLVA